MGLMGMVSDSIPTSTCRTCPALPMPLQNPLPHPLPRHLSLVKQVTSLGRYFRPGFSQV